MVKKRVNRLTVGLVMIGLSIAVIGAGQGFEPASAAESTAPHKQFAEVNAATSFAEVFEQVNPAVVTISVSRSASVEPALGFQQGPGTVPPPFNDFFGRFFSFPMQPPSSAPVAALGSGFFVDADGYIVTNNHVIENADEISVVLADGRRLDAELVGRDPKTDLALIKVSDDEKFPALRFGNSDEARVGEWVLAIGNPFGLGGTATAGIISARGRDIRSGPYDDYLQIDAPINSGNSGGPIVDADGEVIGVNTAIFSPNGGNVGIGFAIPATQAKQIVEDLKVNRVVHRGWLGVQIQGLDEDLARSLGRANSDGALVANVTADSPADKAGIAVGDVITKFGGHEIDSPRTLSFAIADQDPGSTARVHVWRNGKDRSLKVTVAQMEETADRLAANSPAAGTADKLGLRLAPLTDAYRARLGAPQDVDGVVVEAVQPGSEAARKGLRPGDLITEINGSAVSSPGSALQAMADNDRALLLVRRGDSQYFAALALS
ncbi:MAG: DegQ family serine endoprotease [Woeseiaceae bacterium]